MREISFVVINNDKVGLVTAWSRVHHLMVCLEIARHNDFPSVRMPVILLFEYFHGMMTLVDRIDTCESAAAMLASRHFDELFWFLICSSITELGWNLISRGQTSR